MAHREWESEPLIAENKRIISEYRAARDKCTPDQPLK
jgi:hypothetical protein